MARGPTGQAQSILSNPDDPNITPPSKLPPSLGYTKGMHPSSIIPFIQGKKGTILLECSRASTSSRFWNISSRRSAAIFSALLILYLWRFHLQTSIITSQDHSVFGPDTENILSRPSKEILLDVFQVREPVPTIPSAALRPVNSDGSYTQTDGAPQTGSHRNDACTRILMEHSFGFSYGIPFIGNYAPPSCTFDKVTINFTVTSRGRQFDRLGSMYLGDIEVFRTSTAEPTYDGIRWEYLKDMSHYLTLFSQPQKIIFDLGNLIDDTYTTPFNATLTATFFASSEKTNAADVIYPISARRSAKDAPSAFSVPGENASVSIDFPRNVRRAVVSIAACGQGDEEFWFGNVPQSQIDTFPDIAPMLGYSTFREVQLLVDGRLAGVVWPFPIVFTGGVVPGLWRPVVGLDAFDLREHEIDITRLLPNLCDGDPKGHTFEIRVVGIDDTDNAPPTLSNTVGQRWVVSGKIFLWLDEPDHVTVGRVYDPFADQVQLLVQSSVGQNDAGENISLTFDTFATRIYTQFSTLYTSTGTSSVSWRQVLFYTNTAKFTEKGAVQLIEQNTRGYDAATGFKPYVKAYHYPIWVNTSFHLDSKSGNFTIDAPIARGLFLDTWGSPVFPLELDAFPNFKPWPNDTVYGAGIHTTQNGSAHYLGVPSKKSSYGYGQTEQHFSFEGLHTPPRFREFSLDEVSTASPFPGEELYSRHVLAANNTVISDREKISGSITRDFSTTDIPTEKGIQHVRPLDLPRLPQRIKKFLGIPQ